MAFDAPLESPDQERRALALMDEIRCVACENEPISQSNADIAEDMRDRVREMIADGASDADVRAWFSERYGEFVLFRPSTRGTSGIVLWSVPFGLLILGALGLSLSRQRKGFTETIESVAPESFDPKEIPEPEIETIQANPDDNSPAHEPDTES